jgi:FtsP/CotA-like multicopper oxidase with cupredoxin domain
MSSGARIGLLVATVVAIALAFVLLSPGDDDTSTTTSTTAPPPPAQTNGTGGSAPTTTAAPRPAPAFVTIQVRGGKPAGGVKTITVKKGDRVRIEVASPDTSDEIHLHGYDLKRDLKAGGRVRFSFDADAEGIFEIELEGAGTQIGKLAVEP